MGESREVVVYEQKKGHKFLISSDGMVYESTVITERHLDMMDTGSINSIFDLDTQSFLGYNGFLEKYIWYKKIKGGI